MKATPYIYSPVQHRRIVERGTEYGTNLSGHEYSGRCEKKSKRKYKMSKWKEKKLDHSQMEKKSNENGTEEHRVIKWIQDCEHPVVDLMDDAPKVLGFYLEKFANRRNYVNINDPNG